MARGFGATLGIDTNDLITGSALTLPTQSTFAILANRNGEGGGNFGRMVDHGAGATLWAVTNDGDLGVNAVFYPFDTTTGRWSFPRAVDGATASIIITFDGSSTTNDPVCYLNGVSQAVTETITPVGTFNPSSAAPTFGNRADLARCWDGVLSEFALWNRILSVAEIAMLGKSPTSASALHFAAGLVDYRPMIRADISYKLGPGTVSGTFVQPHPPVIYPARMKTHTRIVAAGFTRIVGGGVGGYRLAAPGGLAA